MSKFKLEEVINFWFSNEDKWFNSNIEFDETIRNKFDLLYQAALAGEIDDWQNTPDGVLALVIIYDQFSRNMFRGTALMYLEDKQALELTKNAIDKHWDEELSNSKKRHFLYMPLMHSENKADQDRSVELFQKLDSPQTLKYAKHHREIVHRYGRFPHRNEILGRESTTEEINFLEMVRNNK